MSNQQKDTNVCFEHNCDKKLSITRANELRTKRLEWMKENSIPDLWNIESIKFLCSIHWLPFMDSMLRYKNSQTLSITTQKEIEICIRKLLCEINSDYKEFQSFIK